ncbi:hypothetical protein IAU59_004262 [Kwoniella sp. CBS 9459]
MSDAGSSSAPPSANANGGSGTPDPSRPKDRHEPRGRKPNDQLPPSRAREVQRAFRLRRAEHLASLEERILQLEQENNSLRALLNLPTADRGRIGSGPTGRGKSLKEGGVPMSERVRARKEARERERRALGLPEPDTSEHSEIDMDSRTGRDSMTLSPRANGAALSAPPSAGPAGSAQADQQSRQQQQQQQQQDPSHPQQQQQSQLPTMPSLFTQPESVSPAPFNYQLPMPFNLPVSPDPQFPDFTNNLDTASLYKQSSGSTPNFGGMFSMFDTPAEQPQPPQQHQQHQQQQQQHQTNAPPSSAGPSNTNKPAPISPPINNNNPPNSGFDLLTRLKQCCHVSDSHVVNDPGLLVFATRLCQSFGCTYHGSHVDPNPRSDMEHLTLEDSWRALKMTLDPGGDADGENRINTGKMAAELVVRAAHSRGPGGWIMCRYREGLSIKRSMIAALVTGLGGKMDV